MKNNHNQLHIQRTELLERINFLNFCLSNPRIKIDKQSQFLKGAKWDFCIISSTTTNQEVHIILDVKNRSYDISDQGFWLEKNKYEALVSLAQQASEKKNTKVYPFMCYITPQFVYFVNLLKIKPTFEWTKSWTDSTRKEEQYDLIYVIPPQYNQKFVRK